MKLTLVGYHGTNKEDGQNILRTRFNISYREENWMGNGVYFFENDIHRACYWCTNIEGYSEWLVIKACIECDDDKFWDLTIHEHYIHFTEIANAIKNRYLKTKEGKQRKVIDGVVFNMIWQAEHFHVSRGVYLAPEGKTVIRTRAQPYQTIICVRNRDCIKHPEEVLRNDEYNTA